MKELDSSVYTALKTLNDKGYEAYLVGGAVRDHLLGRENSDYDITTDADPNAIKMIFHDHTLYDVGKKHGTVTVLIDRQKIDITPYRAESDYYDHRHPNRISFSSDLKEDLKRRDFTINAICLDKDGKIIDMHKGMKDLENSLIRTVGDPKTRFSEDALRILRAIRFKAQLNFEIEEKTDRQIHECRELLAYVSEERKKEELLHLLHYRDAFRIINEYLDVFNTFIPFRHIRRKYNDFTDPLFSLAYLLKDEKTPRLKQLKYSNREIELIRTLIASTRIRISDDRAFIDALTNNHQKETLMFLNQYHRRDFNERFLKLREYMVDVNDLMISGNQIEQYGYPKQQIGQIKRYLTELIRNRELSNTPDALKGYLQNHQISI